MRPGAWGGARIGGSMSLGGISVPHQPVFAGVYWAEAGRLNPADATATVASRTALVTVFTTFSFHDARSSQMRSPPRAQAKPGNCIAERRAQSRILRRHQSY